MMHTALERANTLTHKALDRAETVLHQPGLIQGRKPRISWPRKRPKIHEVVRPAVLAMRREFRGHSISRRLGRGQRQAPRILNASPAWPRRKHKTAMALSAGVMALGAANTGPGEIPHEIAAPAPVPGIAMRTKAANLTASGDLKQELANEEGVNLTVYRDVAGNLTVGAGHLVTPADHLKLGDRISHARAIDLLGQDLQGAQDIVRQLVGTLPLYQNEFDALVDLVYNVGPNAVSPANSPGLNQAIANGDYDAIARQLRYVRAGGHKVPGLVYRSDRRQAMFLEASYTDPRPANAAPGDQSQPI